MSKQRLIVKATAGADAPERCSQAFTVAATAVAAGVDVSPCSSVSRPWSLPFAFMPKTA